MRKRKKSDMARHLFLEGPSGCGKSLTILRCLEDILPYAGGFGTCRTKDENGDFCGFCHVPAPEMESLFCSYEPEYRGNFIKYTDGKMEFKRETFSGFTAKLLGDDAKNQFYLIDEIGGTELLIPDFEEALCHRIESDVPCIGVWKAPQNSMSMKQALRPGGDYDAVYSEFGELICQFTVTVETAAECEAAVRRWRAENGL